MSRPSSQRRMTARTVRGGFTMVELMMVIIIIAILAGILLPVINSALKTARKAAVLSEINQLAQALANFKAKYGDYPPSRFLAVENGNYSSYLGSNALLNGSGLDPTSPADGDIYVGQLAQRSVAAIRKFWPRATTNVTMSSTFFYDFNGNGTMDTLPYVLHGHECLVFFLGGIPAPNTAAGTFGMVGFDKNPLNPFTNNNYNSANRQPPFFEFNPGRLYLDPFSASQIPGYYDSLGNAAPVGGTVPSVLNFYAYFSSYGNGGYDPNDVNFYNSTASTYLEYDNSNNGPIGLAFNTNFPIATTKAVTICESYAPNPYTSTLTTGSPVTFQNAQSFQIISSGFDGLYGVGGQYVSNTSSTAVTTLPLDTTNTFYGSTTGTAISSDTDPTIRQREGDNLTNFKGGSLQ